MLAGTFAMLGTLPLVILTEIGFMVAIGVLLDTIIVRSVLVTALTLDIGRWMWWPSRLARPPMIAYLRYRPRRSADRHRRWRRRRRGAAAAPANIPLACPRPACGPRGLADQPGQEGGRFSRNAAMPSRAASVCEVAAMTSMASR